MQDNPHSYLALGIVAGIAGILLVYNKLTDDVIPFEELSLVCSDDIVDVRVDATRGWLWRSHERVIIKSRDLPEAILAQTIPGYRAARSAILSKEGYCLRFNPDSRTRYVHHLYTADQILVDYAIVAPKRRWNTQSTFLIGVFCLLVVVPYYIFRYTQLAKIKK